MKRISKELKENLDVVICQMRSNKIFVIVISKLNSEIKNCSNFNLKKNKGCFKMTLALKLFY